MWSLETWVRPELFWLNIHPRTMKTMKAMKAMKAAAAKSPKSPKSAKSAMSAKSFPAFIDAEGRGARRLRRRVPPVKPEETVCPL